MEAGGYHTLQQLIEKFELLGDCCNYCCDSTSELTVDHNIPLSRGGTNNITNIIPACKSCNSRKHTKTAAEFIKENVNTNAQARSKKIAYGKIIFREVA